MQSSPGRSVNSIIFQHLVVFDFSCPLALGLTHLWVLGTETLRIMSLCCCFSASHPEGLAWCSFTTSTHGPYKKSKVCILNRMFGAHVFSLSAWLCSCSFYFSVACPGQTQQKGFRSRYFKSKKRNIPHILSHSDICIYIYICIYMEG